MSWADTAARAAAEELFDRIPPLATLTGYERARTRDDIQRLIASAIEQNINDRDEC
jgi:hypothetical protein